MLTQAAPSRGFTLIEVLIAIVVLAIGLLGLAKLQVSTNQYEMESYQRAQAVVLLQDMVHRINANRPVASCYRTNKYSPGWLGTGFTAGAATCTAGNATQAATAIADMNEWDQLLKGASEKTNGGNTPVGAMINARGCITYTAGNPQENVITVVYQGLMQTAPPDPSLSCAIGSYGPDSQRRAVSAVVDIANLN